MARKLILFGTNVRKQRSIDSKSALIIDGLNQMISLMDELDLNNPEDLAFLEENIIYLKRFYENIEFELIINRDKEKQK